MRSRPFNPAFVAGLLAAAWGLGACGMGRPRVAGDLVPELALEGVTFRIDRGGVTRATGEADRVTYRRDTTAVAATGLVLLLAGAEGPVRVTAPSGRGIVTDRRFEAVGGLEASRGADRAVTAAAHYEPAEPVPAHPEQAGPGPGPGLVRGTDPVTLSGPGYRLTGTGFTLDPASGVIVIGGGAHLVTGLPVAK